MQQTMFVPARDDRLVTCSWINGWSPASETSIAAKRCFSRASPLSPCGGPVRRRGGLHLGIARTLMMRNRDRSSQATTGDERDAHFVYGKRREHMPALRVARHSALSARCGTAAP